MQIGIIGYGIVGKAIAAFYQDKISISIYDKFMPEYSSYDELLKSDIIFVSVPTPNVDGGIDISAIEEVIEILHLCRYTGCILIKSTLIPGILSSFITKYNTLTFCYNPEFLSAKTNIEDYANQKHIILGIENKYWADYLHAHYTSMFPTATISICKIIEAESVKIFCNVFYAVKIQTFTEFYLACRYNGADFNVVRDLMLKNSWINPMHTNVPNNGQISFSGACFPKDIASLNTYLLENNLCNDVISAAMTESIKHNNHFPE